MGSISDKSIVEESIKILEYFGIEYDLRVISAHRSIDYVIDYAKNMEKNNIDLIIAFAGKSAHLAGVLASLTTFPVIGVPIKSSALDGMDALLSTVQMPTGVPVATVGINASANAAILATQILSIKHTELQDKLKEYKKELRKSVDTMNDNLNL